VAFFKKIQDGGCFFENLRVFPTIDFWRFFWTCSGGPVKYVPKEKCCHLIFLFWAKFWLNMTVLLKFLHSQNQATRNFDYFEKLVAWFFFNSFALDAPQT